MTAAESVERYCDVFPSLTPQGVEHTDGPQEQAPALAVFSSLTPERVCEKRQPSRRCMRRIMATCTKASLEAVVYS